MPLNKETKQTISDSQPFSIVETLEIFEIIGD